MKAHIIHLDRRADRFENIQAQLRKLPLFVRVHTAIDGHVAYAHLPTRRERGHAGCKASHLAVLQEVANGSDTHALILEDDFVILPGFAEALDNFPKEAGLCYLGGNVQTASVTTSHIEGYHHGTGILTTHAYIVSKHAAKGLINELVTNPSVKVDVCFAAWQARNKYRTFIIDKAVVTQLPSDSDIDRKFADYHFLAYDLRS